MRLLSLFAILASLLFVGCGDDADTPLDAGPPPADLGTDGGPGVDGGSDVDGGTGVDGGSDVDGGTDVDSGSDVDGGGDVDGGMSADAGGGIDGGSAVDAGGPRTCVAAGGMCVPVVPGSCTDGVFAGELDCGGGLGVTCCLPRSLAPECAMTGTASEGWYSPAGGLICLARCAGEVAQCRFAGTRSEGWYTTEVAACPTPLSPGYIEFANCAP